ncbi:hypothetical protein [Pedobacter cryophilus]|uniref:Uncharacterized protein n=1 Tax=Pedobacter cryophilus TaxID=2571271 RepID=A0A4U1BXG4_9SPHI|nr:hypothetical protein [Pedobacter cryophilus]TKB96206.1 hypothetical protein FA046_13540 [Pedobacter cryophilus]
MRYILLLVLLLSIHSSFAQKKSIKKAKLEVLNEKKLPFNIDRIQEGFTESPSGSLNKKYLIKGNINLISINWLEIKASPNPLANSYQINDYYYLRKGKTGNTYYQFYPFKGGKIYMQEISRANLLAVFGEEYQSQIVALEKVTIKGVKKIVQAYNTKNPDKESVPAKKE